MDDDELIAAAAQVHERRARVAAEAQAQAERDAAQAFLASLHPHRVKGGTVTVALPGVIVTTEGESEAPPFEQTRDRLTECPDCGMGLVVVGDVLVCMSMHGLGVDISEPAARAGFHDVIACGRRG